MYNFDDSCVTGEFNLLEDKDAELNDRAELNVM